MSATHLSRACHCEQDSACVESKGCAESEGCAERRSVCLALCLGVVGSLVGVGCINVRRHWVKVHVQRKVHVLIPMSSVRKLRTMSDVLEVEVVGAKHPILVRRTASGGWLALSSECTHRSCEVEPTPHSYDCPCHGSRFDLEGQVLAGPASSPLERFPCVETREGLLLKVS